MAMNTTQKAYEFALEDVGRGGNGRQNNEGIWLRLIRLATGLPRLAGGEWCAVVVSFWLMRADSDWGFAVRSRGARKLVRNVLDKGGQQIHISQMKPGDCAIALYRRGKRLHHVRLIRRNRWRWEYVGGNETRKDIVRRRRWLSRKQISKGLLTLAVLP